jgi:two-component system, OmpR family, sensor histidine kinase CreC
VNAWWAPFLSLRWRLAAVALAAMIGGGWWLSSLAADQLHRNYQEAIEESLVDTATIIAAWIAAESVDRTTPTITGIQSAMDGASRTKISARIYDLIKTKIATDVLVTDAAGMVVFDSADPTRMGKDFSRWNDIARTLQGRYGARATRSDPTDQSTAVLHVAAPIRVSEQLLGVVSVSKAVASVSSFMQTAQQGIWRAGMIAGSIAALIALAATFWITRPLTRLVSWAEEVKAGGRPPVPRVGGGEVGRLGAAITGLQASLDGRAYVENYVQHLTHELKSPLAGIRGAAELLAEEPPPDMRRRFLSNIANEGARLQDVIDRLLQLAELERRERAVQAEDIAVEGLIQELIEAFAPQSAQAQVTITTQLEAGLVVRGERFFVRQALANLLANAIDFAPQGSVVSFSARGSDGMIAFTVRDHGPGIPAWALERLFSRFYSLPRPQNVRKGTGLGLVFVREVANLHGGTVNVTNHPNGGAEAVLRLPGL